MPLEPAVTAQGHTVNNPMLKFFAYEIPHQDRKIPGRVYTSTLDDPDERVRGHTIIVKVFDSPATRERLSDAQDEIAWYKKLDGAGLPLPTYFGAFQSTELGLILLLSYEGQRTVWADARGAHQK